MDTEYQEFLQIVYQFGKRECQHGEIRTRCTRASWRLAVADRQD